MALSLCKIQSRTGPTPIQPRVKNIKFKLQRTLEKGSDFSSHFPTQGETPNFIETPSTQANQDSI